jgi:ACS family glucarate transporter-like MFS transporter
LKNPINEAVLSPGPTAATGEPESSLRLRPTAVRWQMMALVTVTTILTYLDRLNLSIAGHYIQNEFSLSLKTMGWILSSFLFGYSLSQIPGGYLADRFGPRKVLIAAISWWSVLTAATAIAPRLPVAHWFGVAYSIAMIRFLIGIGEAPSSPSYTKVVANWMGQTRRGFGSSFNLLGIGLGGALTPVLITFIMQRWGWRTAFYSCGTLGILVALTWYFFATDRPEQHHRVNRAEIDLIGRGRSYSTGGTEKIPVPWGRILTNRSVIALVLGYFCQGFPIYFFHTWLFVYLIKVRGFSLTQGGFYGATPYIAIAVLSPLGGLFSDFAVRIFDKPWGQRLAVWIGMFSSAGLMWAGAHAPNKVTAILLLAVAAGCNMFASVTFWFACIDLGQQHSGSVAGLMNTFGNLAGAFSPIVTAYVAARFGWTSALSLAALVTAGSGLFWLGVDTTKKIGTSAGVLPNRTPSNLDDFPNRRS